ncbi:MAG: valine--tRNA ligase, partial [archaeon]|nr:valine--tRNA ligase [archaeon]
MTENKGTDFRAIEQKWQKQWESDKVYSFDSKRDGSIYSIDTPPPTVSGKMHLGHAFSYSQADFIARYKRMQGFNVFYPFGFDDNGLATERLVEKSRKIRAKDFTREEFIRICLEETKKHEEIMKDDFYSLGLSVDWNLLYRTIDSFERKTSQKSFIEIHKMKRAYRKEAPSMWCPTCETAIAQAELEDKEFPSNFVYIKAEVEGGKQITYATTRPELLHACICITVHPDDKRYKEVVGKKAKIPISNEWVPIIADESAKIDFGTGAVYWCPYSDATSIEFVAKHPQFKVKSVVGKDGRLNEVAKEYAGLKIKEAREKIIDALQKGNHVEKIEPITHDVSVHERCKTQIEVYSTKQWFIKYMDLKKEFLKKGEELNWFPKQHMKVRYANWIKGLQWDWSISRQRFFGVPFPVWYCKNCEAEILADEKQLPVDPIQDKPPVKECPKCKCKEFVPEKDVLDTWMTSSLTPQINSRWAEDKEFHKKLFPMSMRPQAHDIITLWAFNTIVKGYFHDKKLPWKDIMISGHALDSKGRKMSKSLGNVIEPIEMIEKYSADMLRYWAAAGSLGEDLPFQEKEFISGKKFLMKLFNASRFVAMKTEGIKADDFEKVKGNLM